MTQAYNLSQLANNLNTVGQLDASDGLVNAVPAANGGTGQSAYTVGDVLYASTTTALAKLSDIATGNVLISGGVGAAPSYGKVGLSTHVNGTLLVANGGTGLTTIASNNVLLGNGTSNLQTVAPGASGTALISNGTTWASGNVSALSTASGSAPSYSARAWVNFNGISTVTIRSGGNVSSITDNGVGDYTLNFTTAMLDGNYIGVQSVERSNSNTIRFIAPYVVSKTISAYRVTVTDGADAPIDATDVYVAIFR